MFIFKMTEKYVVPKLAGGLGNQLFILASAIDVGNRCGRKTVFKNKTGNRHCTEKMNLSLMFPAVETIMTLTTQAEYAGGDCTYRDLVPMIDPTLDRIMISGYNQHPAYIPAGFSSFIHEIPDVTPYTNMSNVAYLHVRRTDYVGDTTFNQISLDLYYQSAVKHLLAQNPQLSILLLSDDLEWTNKQMPLLLKDILPANRVIQLSKQYTATETLKIMYHCQAGAICANSTFSWWGAYCNRERAIYMPFPWSWHSGKYSSLELGLYFDGVVRICRSSGKELPTSGTAQNGA